MKILIIGLNYAPEMVGIGPYTTGTAEALVDAGHNVRVIAGKPYYPRWVADPAYAGALYHHSVENGVAIVRCPHYVPGNPTGIKRILHHLSFALTAAMPAWRAAREFDPDIVLTIAPSLLAVPVARMAARRASARLWIHVQDFEVEAAFVTGLLKDHGWVSRLASWFEAWQLRNADRISTISPQMVAKLRDKKVYPARIQEFRNWSDTNRIRPTDTSIFRAEWRITAPHIALYSGNIANKQGINIVIDAARHLHHRQDLAFVICGQGPNRAELEARAAGLDNVHIYDLQSNDRLNDLLALADVHLLPQILDAADLVLPSKLANMLASGRPIVATAARGTGLYSEVEGCGVSTPPGDVDAFADAIIALIDDPDRRVELGRAARIRGLTRWDRSAVLDRMISQIEISLAPEIADRMPGKVG